MLTIALPMQFCRDNRGRDHMVVGFITIYAISAYHHKPCEVKLRSGEVYLIQHYMISCK